MSERFERIFTLPGNLYAAGAPVIISAGALLRDTENGRILAQLKFQSISPNPIKAVKVHIFPLDTVGKSLGGEISYDYLDLNAERDAEFGQKKAIPVANPATRSFTAEVTEVAFADNSLWTTDDKQWAPLPESVPIENALGDREMAKQYRLRYGQNARYQPAKIDGIWLCTCGAVNAEEEEKCHVCGSEAGALFSCDLKELKAETAERVEQETAVEKKQAQKRKRFASVLIPVAIVCIAAILLATKVFIPGSKYKQATALLDAGQYDEAIAAFEALGEYKDSTEQAKEANLAKTEAKNAVKYEDAMHLLESGLYDGAIKFFTELGDYRDSTKRLEAAVNAKKYEEAKKLAASDDWYAAYHLFIELGEYEDAKHLALQIKEEYPFSCVEVGERVFFGSYEQDNNFENGKEPIEWFVVDVTEDKVSLLSVYCLDVQRFSAKLVENVIYHEELYRKMYPDGHYKEIAGAWEDTTLYKWLNDYFIVTAFNEHEKNGLTDPVSLQSYHMACDLPTNMKQLLVSEYAKSLDNDIHFLWLALNAEKHFQNKSEISTGAVSYWRGEYRVDNENYARVSKLGGVRPVITVRTDY